jgi:hypothetical protein
MSAENPLVAEMEAYAARAELDVASARRSNRLQGVLYGVLIAFLLGYLGWAFVRLAPFADPGYSARIAADVVGFRLELMIGEFGGTARELAPSVVRELETQVLGVVPTFRGQLESFVAKDLPGAVTKVLSDGDRRLVASLKESPDGLVLVRATLAKPGLDADELLAFTRAHPAPAAVPAEGAPAAEPAKDDSAALLLTFRDTVRRLAANRDLDASEKAQRRLLQLIIAQAEASRPPEVAPDELVPALEPEAAPAPAPAKGKKSP